MWHPAQYSTMIFKVLAFDAIEFAWCVAWGWLTWQWSATLHLHQTPFIYIIFIIYSYYIIFLIICTLIMNNHDCTTFQCQESSQTWKWSQWTEQTQQSEQEKSLGFEARGATWCNCGWQTSFSIPCERSPTKISITSSNGNFYLQGFCVIFFFLPLVVDELNVVGKGHESWVEWPNCAESCTVISYNFAQRCGYLMLFTRKVWSTCFAFVPSCTCMVIATNLNVIVISACASKDWSVYFINVQFTPSEMSRHQYFDC